MRQSRQPQRWIFQSTHPVRGGTDPWTDADQLAAISIHPPREGWDQMPPGAIYNFWMDFNPPTP